MQDVKASQPVLFLQGPIGPFFANLALALQALGVPTFSVRFNLADCWFSRKGGPGFYFKGDLEQWEAWLREFRLKQQPRCIMLIGDMRPRHRAARKIAEELGIPLYAFEEGYIRPDFITLEKSGNNANSSFVMQPGYTYDPERPVAERHVGPTFMRIARWATYYYILMDIGRVFYAGYVHHRNRSATLEAILWWRSFFRKWFSTIPDTNKIKRLVREKTKNYFVLILQVHDDLQLIHHHGGWDQDRLIGDTIASFARHAASDAELVVRCHPLDRGHRSFAGLVNAAMEKHRLQGRVHLMYTGHGPTLLEHAAGSITINSTMALSSMYHECPVLILGDAFFAIPGLGRSGRSLQDIDEFWKKPGQVDHELFMRFRAQLIEQTQINGSYYDPSFFSLMSSSVIARLAADGVLPVAQ